MSALSETLGEILLYRENDKIIEVELED
jgi:nucleoredoxin